MNRDSYMLETVRTHYADEILAALYKCKHGDAVDYPSLTQLLKKMGAAARAEGLEIAEFDDLVKTTLTGVWEDLQTKQKAA
jgi:hypothetical protein